MFRSPILVLGLLLFSASAFGQANPSDSQNLQAVLAELRQLRQDFETTTVATQRIQILLYRLQAQEAAVARASRRLDDADAELARIAADRARLVSDIKQHEDFVRQTENPPAERKNVEEVLPQLKARLEASQNQEQMAQAKQADYREQLRLEQAKLDDLQANLERLEKSLAQANHSTADNPH